MVRESNGVRLTVQGHCTGNCDEYLGLFLNNIVISSFQQTLEPIHSTLRVHGRLEKNETSIAMRCTEARWTFTLTGTGSFVFPLQMLTFSDNFCIH